MSYLWLLLIGLVAGVFAGMFGIGGGLIIVPALMFLMKVKVLEAIGTSLAALIPPVGLLGAAEYYRNGYIRLGWAALLALGLFTGAWFGARLMISLPEVTIRRVYAVFLMLISLRMLLMGK
ncbi:MAG: sulfite exporter TauE/SafE family protein [Acidobacteriota bacterium]